MLQHTGLGVTIGQHATAGAAGTVQAIILAATIAVDRLPHDSAWQDQTRAEAILVDPKVTIRSTVPTKLRIPEIGAKLVFRPSLMHLLDEGLAHNLTLVCAPAGYGKTTSVAMWIRTLGAPSDPGRPAEVTTAWYSLDSEDNDVSTFFIRFAAAIETGSPGALQAITSGLAVQAPPIYEFANALAEACLKLPQPVVLVLDDYHLIGDAGIHTILFHLIQYASARLHLVITSRHDPPLRIARLRAQHQVAEVRGADLRLTEQETNELLQMRLAQQPSAELVAQLQSRAEGWVAGLQLAAASVRGFDDQDAFVDAFRRSNNLYVMDYLFDEVLVHQPEDVQEFLLKTALLVRFNVLLAAQVTRRAVAECRRILDDLRQQNLFVVALDSEHNWHRYHHQFHALLADRAHATLSAGEINAIRSDAASWLAGHGWIDEALAETIAARLWEAAADLIESDRHRLQNREDWQPLWHRVSQLPDDVVAQHPGLLLARAWVLQVNDRLAAVPPLVEQAEALLSSAASFAGSVARQELLGEVYALKGSWIFPETPVEQRIDYLEQALALLPARKAGWVRGFAQINLANHLVTLGQRDVAYQRVLQEIEASSPAADAYLTRLHHALFGISFRDGSVIELLQHALRYRELVVMNKMPVASAWASFGVGWAHFERCEPALALDALLQVFDQPYSVHLENMVWALTALVPAAAELGQDAQASRLVEQARRIALERENFAAADEFAALSAYAALLRHDDRSAMAWAERFVQSPLRYQGAQRRSLGVTSSVPVFARTALANRSTSYLQEAANLLEAYVSMCQARGHMAFTAHGAVLLACCNWRIERPGPALAALQLAVDIAWPRGLLRPFCEPGTDVASMLYAMVQRGLSAEAASALLAELDARQAPTPQQVHREEARAANLAIVPLSEREVEILALVAARLSNKEIARQLGISPLTVRNHTSNIYTKLNVASRQQAVALAQRLGLLPPR